MKDVVTLAAAYFSSNPVRVDEIEKVLKNIHSGLRAIEGNPEVLTPAVPISESVTDDYIVCLEDGKKLQMLKRYLRQTHHMEPEEYRAKWGLPDDYPMVAPGYARKRSQIAKDHGLGRPPA